MPILSVPGALKEARAQRAFAWDLRNVFGEGGEEGSESEPKRSGSGQRPGDLHRKCHSWLQFLKLQHLARSKSGNG